MNLNFEAFMTGAGHFLVAFGLAALFLGVFKRLYQLSTPYDEAKLIGQGNVAAAVALGGAIIGFALKFTMGWRIAEEDEVEGVDVTTHGEAAYDIEPQSGSGGMSGVLTTAAHRTQEVKA